jgi:hypothetical protein
MWVVGCVRRKFVENGITTKASKAKSRWTVDTTPIRRSTIVFLIKVPKLKDIVVKKYDVVVVVTLLFFLCRLWIIKSKMQFQTHKKG